MRTYDDTKKAAILASAERNRRLDGTVVYMAVARETGCDRNTIRRFLSTAVLPEVKATAPQTVIELDRLKAENAKLRKELADARTDAFELDAIHTLIGRMADAPKNPQKWRLKAPNVGKNLPEVPATIWSDWHYDEVVSLEETGGVNQYNTEIAEERINRLIERTIDICRHHGPKNIPGIVINLLGDNISGGLHPELLRTDEFGRIPASIRVHDIMAGALTRMADEFGNVYVPCASGNHGRNTHKPEYKGYVYHNFDWLVYEMLRRTLANDKRIVLDNPVANQVYYRIFNLRFLAMHGDMLGVKGGDGIIGAIGPIMRGEFKTRRQSGAVGQDYDYLLIGHYHQFLWLRNTIAASSIKGYDEYAKNVLRAAPEPPTQPLFFVSPKHGITSRWNIHVENQADTTEKNPWISVFNH